MRGEAQIRMLATLAVWLFVESPAVQAQTAPSRSGKIAVLGPPIPVPVNIRFLTPVVLETRPVTLPLPQTVESEFQFKQPTFQLEPEIAFRERLRDSYPQVKNVQFPKDVPVTMPPQARIVSPPLSVMPIPRRSPYEPLYFEETKTERYGYYVPYLQPLISTTKFYANVALLPYRMCVAPPWNYEYR